MTHDNGKSDKPIVPEKGANKRRGGPRPAERVEERGLAKGNLEKQNRYWFQRQADLQHALDRIRAVTTRDREESIAQSVTANVIPEVGARCGNSARRDLCGGWPVRAIPTANRLLRLLPRLFLYSCDAQLTRLAP